MEIMMISFNAVAPLVILIVLGNMLRRYRLISMETANQINHITYLIFIPVLLFNNIYQTEIKEIMQPKLILFAVIAIIATWGISFALTLPIEKSPKTRGAMIQGMFRSNFTLYGLPIVIFLYGQSQAGVTSFMIAVVVPMFNILATITLEYFRGGKVKFRRFVFEILRNPLMIGSVLGVIALALHIGFPVFVEKSLDTTASLAVPLSLIMMGARFNFTATKSKIGKLTLTVVMRLIIIPVIFLTVSIFLGFRNVELASLMALFAAPTAIVSYPMAEQMNSDGEFACNVVILTTIVSCLTVFICLCVLQKLGFILII